jgi:hypothetical protein
LNIYLNQTKGFLTLGLTQEVLWGTFRWSYRWTRVIERQSDIRKYLEPAWNKRLTPVWGGDQHWDNDMMDSFAITRLEGIQRRGSASRQRVLGTLIDSCDYRELSDEFKRRILYEYGKELFAR